MCASGKSTKSMHGSFLMCDAGNPGHFANSARYVLYDLRIDVINLKIIPKKYCNSRKEL